MDYKNLFWTRLMNIENYESDRIRKFALAPDLIEECQAVADLNDVNVDYWEPIFDRLTSTSNMVLFILIPTSLRLKI